MKVKAQNRFVRQSPYKVRRVLDLVRGLAVEEASDVLRLTNRAAAKPIEKTLASALANAEHNHALEIDELVISEAFADEGPTLRRFKPRARGRATRIDKRTSHITIVLSEVNPVDLNEPVDMNEEVS